MTENPSEDELTEEFDEILLEFLREHDAKKVVDREAFLGQYPQFRDRLAQLLETADWIEKMAGPTRSAQTTPWARWRRRRCCTAAAPRW
jgi:hypothetical protein